MASDVGPEMAAAIYRQFTEVEAFVRRQRARGYAAEARTTDAQTWVITVPMPDAAGPGGPKGVEALAVEAGWAPGPGRYLPVYFLQHHAGPETPMTCIYHPQVAAVYATFQPNEDGWRGTYVAEPLCLECATRMRRWLERHMPAKPDPDGPVQTATEVRAFVNANPDATVADVMAEFNLTPEEARAALRGAGGAS